MPWSTEQLVAAQADLPHAVDPPDASLATVLDPLAFTLERCYLLEVRVIEVEGGAGGRRGAGGLVDGLETEDAVTGSFCM